MSVNDISVIWTTHWSYQIAVCYSLLVIFQSKTGNKRDFSLRWKWLLSWMSHSPAPHTHPTPSILASHIYRSFISNILPFSGLSIIIFWFYEELWMSCISYFQFCVCIMSISEVIFYLSSRMKISCTATVIFHFCESIMHSRNAFHWVSKCDSSHAPLSAGCCLPSLFTYYLLSNASVRIRCWLSPCSTLRHQEGNLAIKIEVPLITWSAEITVRGLIGIKARKKGREGPELTPSNAGFERCLWYVWYLVCSA